MALTQVRMRLPVRVSEARSGISWWMDFYNERRPHSALDDRTPQEAWIALGLVVVLLHAQEAAGVSGSWVRLLMDNVFIERLWRSLKYECVYLSEFFSRHRLRGPEWDQLVDGLLQRAPTALCARRPDAAGGVH